MPTWLVFIGNIIRIHDVDLAAEPVQYAALTYCWGGDQPFKPTKILREDYRNMIPAARLEGYKTIHDAIDVAHALDLQYIWIDSLCIIQDDPDDVTREISEMGKIFEGACGYLSSPSSN